MSKLIYAWSETVSLTLIRLFNGHKRRRVLHSFLILLVAGLFSLKTILAAQQTPFGYQDTFLDSSGLSASTGVEVVSGDLVLKHSTVNPGNYLTAGSGISLLINPLIMTVPADMQSALATTALPDGRIIFGGLIDTGYFGQKAVLYEYNPVTKKVIDLNFPAGFQSVTALVTGMNSRIYLAVYGNPGGAHLFMYNPFNQTYSDKGIAVEGETVILSLTVGSDGRIWGGTGEDGHLFVFDPITNRITDKGSIKVGPSRMYSLATGPDGRIWGGLSWNNQGRLIVYNPATGIVTDKGQVVSGETNINALTFGGDGKIYGGTSGFNGGAGYFFGFDPGTSTVTYRRNVGGLYALTTGPDGKIYGGARLWWDEYLFVYDPADGSFSSKGRIAAGDSHISDLTVAPDGSIYGCYSVGSTGIFRYDPVYPQMLGWGNLTLNAIRPAGTDLRVHVLDANDNVLLYDVTTGTSLAHLNPSVYPALKLRADLSSDGARTPRVQDWAISFSLSPQPDYTVALAPPSISVMPGQTVIYTVTVSSVYGFASPVSLSVAGMPGGVRASVSPSTLVPTGTAFITVRPTFRAAYGTFAFNAVGRSVNRMRADGALLNIIPMPPASTIVIPEQGGGLTYTHEGWITTTVTLPAGIITATATLDVAPNVLTDTLPLILVGPIYELSLTDNDTGQQIGPAPGATYTLSIQYDEQERGPAIEETLALYYWDGAQWTREPSSEVDPARNEVTATPGHFSRWGLMGETWTLYLPSVAK